MAEGHGGIDPKEGGDKKPVWREIDAAWLNEDAKGFSIQV